MRHLRVAAVLGLAFLACKGERTLPAPSKGTPVFIISVDTLRSDHLPAYGYSKVQTPNIDAFRSDAVLYERAYSQYPLTLPSHTSILTGRLPADHGVRDNTGFRIRPGVKTLQEILRDRGYATGAAVSTFILRHETGIDRGFDFYDDAVAPLDRRYQRIGAIQRDGAETEKVATEWIGKQTKPVFFLLHLYEPHTPYSPPEPYRSRYSNAYDGEIARVDEIIGDFLRSLKQRGLYDRSLVILLSDHGEGLNEHGEAEHGMFLYREAIQVPLMVKLPNSKFGGRSVRTPVQLIDVVPTVLERTGIEAVAGLPGRSLASFILETSPAQRSVYSESYYTRFHYGWSAQHSLIDGEHHYIDSTRAELFNLKSDPDEKTNTLDSDRRTFFAMKQALQPLIHEASAPQAATAEEIAKLAALGYLGSTVQTRPGEVLPDPKDHIADVQKVYDAFTRYYQRQYPQALAMLEPLLQRNPRLLDLWDLKSKTLARLGRAPEAVEASKTGLRLSPNADYFALDVATLQLELGNVDDAEKHAELAVDSAPAQAHELLALVWIARKDLDRAEVEARKSIEKDPNRMASLLTMARIQRERGQYDGALELLNEAVRRKKEHEEVEGLYFVRGDVMARLGRAEEAEADFRREITLFPEDARAYKNLVLLLVAEGRAREGAQLIRDLVAEAPVPASYIAVCEVLKTVGDVRGVRYWARQGLMRFPNDRVLTRIAS